MPFRRIGQGPSQSLPTFESPLHPQHTLSYTHAPAETRPCPCLLAASLHTGSILPSHGLRGAGVSVCVCLGVYWCIQHIEYAGKPLYMCVCVRPCIKGCSCVCFMFFEVITLLTCVQKAHTGLNSCGRLMCAGVYACDSKREGDRQMQHARM